MNPSKPMSYIERQIEMQKAQMLSAIMTDSDESDAEEPPQKKPKTEAESKDEPEPVEGSEGTSGATLEKILREVQVVLGQVKKLSDTVKANEKTMKSLKADVQSIKDSMVQRGKEKTIEIKWPITDPEKFQKYDEKIKRDWIYAERMATNFKSPTGERILRKYFSPQILIKYSEAGKNGHTAIKDSPFLNLIANTWSEVDNKSYLDTIAEMDAELLKIRKCANTERYRKKKRNGTVTSVKREAGESAEDDLGYSFVLE